MPFYDAQFDFTGVKQIQDDIANLPTKFADAMLDTSIEVEQTFLPQLQEYPPPRDDSIFRFKTARSRRKWFAMLANGEVNTDGSHYIRTGGYRRSWQVDIGQNGDVFQLRVGTQDRAARGGTTIGARTFAGGQFLPTLVAEYIGGVRQVPGHGDTGWIKFDPILDEISVFMNRRFFEIVSKYLV